VGTSIETVAWRCRPTDHQEAIDSDPINLETTLLILYMLSLSYGKAIYHLEMLTTFQLNY